MSAPSSDTRGPLLALAAMGSLTLALGVVWLAVDVGAPDVGQSRPGIGDNPWVPRASGRSIAPGPWPMPSIRAGAESDAIS
jgi:hypothetical protein